MFEFTATKNDQPITDQTEAALLLQALYFGLRDLPVVEPVDPENGTFAGPLPTSESLALQVEGRIERQIGSYRVEAEWPL